MNGKKRDDILQCRQEGEGWKPL